MWVTTCYYDLLALSRDWATPSHGGGAGYHLTSSVPIGAPLRVAVSVYLYRFKMRQQWVPISVVRENSMSCKCMESDFPYRHHFCNFHPWFFVTSVACFTEEFLCEVWKSGQSSNENFSFLLARTFTTTESMSAAKMVTEIFYGLWVPLEKYRITMLLSGQSR